MNTVRSRRRALGRLAGLAGLPALGASAAGRALLGLSGAGLLPSAAMAQAVTGPVTDGAQAAPAGAGSGPSQLRAFVREVKGATGRFAQRTEGDGGAPQLAAGRFAFARPGRFRWAIEKPEPQLLVADGERLWMHDPGLAQVVVRPLRDVLGASPAAILFGSADIEREFTLRDAGQRDGLGWVDCLPKRREAFDTVSIGMAGGLPRAMVLRDAFGRTTRLTFDDVRRDASPDASAFRFVPPAGVDVIRQ